MVEIKNEWTGETIVTGKEPEVNPKTGEIIEQGESQEKTGDSTGNDAAGGTGGVDGKKKEDEGDDNFPKFPVNLVAVFEDETTDDDGDPIYGTFIGEMDGNWLQEIVLREKNIDELRENCKEIRKLNQEKKSIEDNLASIKRTLKAKIEGLEADIEAEIEKTENRISDTANVFVHLRIFERKVPGTGIFSKETSTERNYVISHHDEYGNEYKGLRRVLSGNQQIPEKYRVFGEERPFSEIVREDPKDVPWLYLPAYIDETLPIKTVSIGVENASETSDEKSDAGSDASETKIDAATEASKTEAPGSDAASENDGKGGKKTKKAGKKEKAG